MLILDDKEFQVHNLILNRFKTNCYIINTSRGAILIDPTANPEEIDGYIKAHEIDIKYMLATHGHFDHISAASKLISLLNLDGLYIHRNDFKEIKNANLFSKMVDKSVVAIPDKLLDLDDKDLNTFLASTGIEFKLLPGHTKGSCVFYSRNKKFVFTGDTILNNLINVRLKFPSEKKKDLYLAQKYIFDEFENDTIIFPGHGKPSLCHMEQIYNSKYLHLEDTYS